MSCIIVNPRHQDAGQDCSTRERCILGRKNPAHFVLSQSGMKNAGVCHNPQNIPMTVLILMHSIWIAFHRADTPASPVLLIGHQR